MINKFKYDLVPYTRGIGVEISSEQEKLFPHIIKWSPEGLKLLRPESMDFVCYDKVDADFCPLEELVSLVKPFGHFNIVLDTSVSVRKLLKNIKGLTLQETISSQYDKLYVFTKDSSGKVYVPPKSKKTCAVLRYGGIGDMMMASIIFPELQKQGYHVTLYTHPNSYEVVKYNQHIDRFIIQDSGQVPANEFRDFCLHTSKKYDKFINLSESIEGTLLSLPDRVSYYWPKEVRHEQMKKNYYEMTAKIAEVPLRLTENFKATVSEQMKAHEYRDPLGTPTILWVLSGSSVHKFWPGMDQMIARILIEYPEAEILLVGDASSRILEQGWEREPRVHCLSGVWTVRETMTFCEEADLIITPETGVALASQFTHTPKVLLLSHSSPSNYASSWSTCTPVIPQSCECYPCHQMHYGFEHCSTIELSDGSSEAPATISECQYSISVDQVMVAVNKYLKEK